MGRPITGFTTSSTITVISIVISPKESRNIKISGIEFIDKYIYNGTSSICGV